MTLFLQAIEYQIFRQKL